MKISEFFSLSESSGYSFAGSFTPDLVFSKFWLMSELNQIQPNISTAYILGSWYGNLALLMSRYGIPKVDQFINVEPNKKFLRGSQRMLELADVNNVEYMAKDANNLDYRQLDSSSVVINTSLTDMQGNDWFKNIPTGTLVALQARDHDPGRQFNSPTDIQTEFPLSQLLYSGSLSLQDPETRYQRFMTIGRR